MMLKTLAVLFFVAVCSAMPVDEPIVTVTESKAPLEEHKLPLHEPIGIIVKGPVKEGHKDEADLKTDATAWSYNYRYPHFQGYYGPGYTGPSLYYSSWWNTW